MKFNIDERPDLVTADAMHRGPHFKKIVHKGLVEAELLAGIQYRAKSARARCGIRFSMVSEKIYELGPRRPKHCHHDWHHIRHGGWRLLVTGRPAGARWHAPAHQDELALCAGVAHNWSGIIWKYPRHRRQIADVAAHDAEEGGDGALISSDRIEVTHRQLRSYTRP